MSSSATLREHLRSQTDTLIRRFAAQVHRAKTSLDEDSVHDLRVSIRRIGEFLETFESLYPKTGVRAVRSETRKIMKGAEKVRSADIALGLLRKAELADDHPLVLKTRGQRTHDEEGLRQSLDGLARHPYPKVWSQELKLSTNNQPVMAWDENESALGNARRVLPDLLDKYFKKGRKLDKNSKVRQMHRFRLRTKNLRYTLDVFAGLYGKPFKRRIDKLRPIQKALGELNDCEVLLSDMGNKLPKQARQYVEKRADEKRKEFLQYWQERFDADGEDHKWVLDLTRSHRPEK